MTILLALLYPLAIQYERGGWWRIIAPVTVLALLIDVIANYTELSLAFWEWPRYGEWTFSTRLNRLITWEDWRGSVARPIAAVLNYIAPSGKHIEALQGV
jgi:hypothetical protein